jgi:hypothetical protein
MSVSGDMSGKRKGSDAKSTMTKKTKNTRITNFTFENVEEEIQSIMEEFGKEKGREY